MSDDFRRRRRLSNKGTPRRSRPNGVNPWVITIFAALVVILGGWFLGQALARVFNGPAKNEKVAQAPTPVPIVTPVSSASPAAEATASPAPSPTPTASPKPTPQATPAATATVKVTTAPVETAAPAAASTAAAAPARPTPVPAASTPAASAAPVATAAPAPASAHETPASGVVRAYIDALRRGDPGAASAYLGNGVPDESFIDASTRINSVTSTRNGDGSYKVSVDMHTAQGEYYETFTVASDRILEKTAIKP